MLDMQKRLSNSFNAIISLPSTAMGFALCIQISALSWLLSTKYHLDIHEIGIVWAAGPLAGIIGQVLIGLISDGAWFWGGRRRPFILIGGTLAALMVFLLPRIDVVANLLGIGNLLVVAVIVALTLDLSINIGFNPTRALIADVTPDGEARTKGFTWMQTISGFWGVMAYLIGAFIDNYALISIGVLIVFAFSVVPMFFVTEPRELAVKSDTVAATSDRMGPAVAHLLRARFLVDRRAVDVRLHHRLHPAAHRRRADFARVVCGAVGPCDRDFVRGDERGGLPAAGAGAGAARGAHRPRQDAGGLHRHHGRRLLRDRLHGAIRRTGCTR